MLTPCAVIWIRRRSCMVRVVEAFLLAALFLHMRGSADTFRPLVMGKRAVVAAGHPLKVVCASFIKGETR
jgi:hypothetical protein